MKVQMQSVNSHFPLGSSDWEFARKIKIGHRLGIVLGFTTLNLLAVSVVEKSHQIRNSNCSRLLDDDKITTQQRLVLVGKISQSTLHSL